MRGLKMHMNGLVDVDWSAEVTGINLLKQRAITNMLTATGSDPVNPSRGTDLSANLRTMGAYNLMPIQHELNFAANDVLREMNAPPGTIPDEDNLTNFSITLTGMTDGRPNAFLSLTNAAGTKVGTTTAL